MSRTDQEFKAEVLRRSEEYRRRRNARRKKVRSSALCVLLLLGGMYLVRPFFAMGGSSEPMENDMAQAPMEAPMSAEGSYSVTGAPGAAAEYSFTADMEEAKEDSRRRMVMIDGTLYVDTGRINDEVLKCGTPDGKITSYAAEGEIPCEDDQSNFGVGYDYQYGSENGTVIIRIDGAWRVFAAEETR